MNRYLRSLPVALVLTLAVAGAAYAGTIYLLNGEEIDGEIVDVGADEVTIKYRFGNMRINLREVRDIELRAGESIWETKIREALEVSRRKAAEDSARLLEEKLRRRGVDPHATAAVPSPWPVEPPPAPRVEPPRPAARMFANVFESEAWGFKIRYPRNWEAREEAPGFFTFRDPRDASRTSWSFDVTAFDAIEASYERVAAEARAQLERLPGYRFEARGMTLDLWRLGGERTVGVYEKDGRAIRHDQVLLKTRRGTLLLHFFSPGAPLEAGGVPDVEGVLTAMEVR